MKNGTARLQRVCSPEGTIQTKLPAWHQNNPNRSCRLWHKSKTEYGGKTMKKLCHRVSIFLAFLLLLTIVVGIAATAHARACNHNWIWLLEVKYETTNSQEHIVSDIKHRECTICGTKDNWTIIGVELESHDKYSRDGGHVVGTQTHKWITLCGKNCGYSETQTYTCSGPPCVNPFSLTPETE